jgi:hypothetical protein
MNEPLEPMAPGLKALLQQGADVGPPPGTAARVLSQLQAATATPAHAPSPSTPIPSAAGTVGWGAKWLAAGLIIGAAGGLIVGRTVFERVEVRVVERPVPVVGPEPLSGSVQPQPPPEAKATPPTLERKETRRTPAPTDASLAQERSVVETARSALVRGDASRALESLNEHQRRFGEGRLVEERESLAIQALLRLGQTSEARTRATSFHQRWPDSLFGPVVDAAFQ